MLNVRRSFTGRSCLVIVFCLINASCFAQVNWWADSGFRQRLASSILKFSGDATGDYFVPSGTVASQIGDGLGGPPNQAKPLPDGTRLLSATRPKSSDEMAAVIIDSNTNVIAAAIVSFGCHYEIGLKPGLRADAAGGAGNSVRRVSCNTNPFLTIFRNKTLSGEVQDAFIRWAEGYYPKIQHEQRQLE